MPFLVIFDWIFFILIHKPIYAYYLRFLELIFCCILHTNPLIILKQILIQINATYCNISPSQHDYLNLNLLSGIFIEVIISIITSL